MPNSNAKTDIPYISNNFLLAFHYTCLFKNRSQPKLTIDRHQIVSWNLTVNLWSFSISILKVTIL